MGTARFLYVQPFPITVFLKTGGIYKRYPCFPSNGRACKASGSDHIEQRACFNVVDYDPICDFIDFHPEAYFLERRVPVRSQLCLVFSQTLKSVFNCVGFVVGPVRWTVVELSLKLEYQSPLSLCVFLLKSFQYKIIFTLFPSIFITSVQPPDPHPVISVMWQ